MASKCRVSCCLNSVVDGCFNGLCTADMRLWLSSPERKRVLYDPESDYEAALKEFAERVAGEEHGLFGLHHLSDQTVLNGGGRLILGENGLPDDDDCQS